MASEAARDQTLMASEDWGVLALDRQDGQPFYVIAGQADDLKRLSAESDKAWAPGANLEPLRALIERMRLAAPYRGVGGLAMRKIARAEARDVVSVIKNGRAR
jgi:hypothetical protein